MDHNYKKYGTRNCNTKCTNCGIFKCKDSFVWRLITSSKSTEFEIEPSCNEILLKHILE